MKIGILGCFYDCADTLPDALSPWRSAKETLQKAGHELFFAAFNCQFTEYAELGYANDDRATRAILEKNKDLFDWSQIHASPLKDHEARSVVLKQLLDAKVDLVWIVDGDELYTTKEIEKILAFVEEHPEPDYFSINFKNYVFDGKQWMRGFHPPRIFRVERHGGLSSFVWENDIGYADGTSMAQAVNTIIPEQVAHVKHLTWLNRFGKKKIEYQLKHFGYSSYRFNEKENTLEFDPAYYARFNEPVPRLFSDSEEGNAVSLSIILRTCDRGDVHPGKRCVNAPKSEIIVRCLRSLVRSANLVESGIKLHIVDDHSSPEALSRMKKELELLRHPSELEALEETGNNASMIAVCKKAAEATGLVYLVEDDYLHTEEALPHMLAAHALFTERLGGKQVALAPHDDPYDYFRMDPCRIVPGPDCPWRTNLHTTLTMFLHSEVVREYRSLFDALAQRYGKDAEITEETTVNRIWKEGGAVLFSPLPSLAFHLQEIPPRYENWKKVWDEAGKN